MIHKVMKLFLGIVMLAAMTGAYASNTGVIKVTNSCVITLRGITVWSKPNGLSCWGMSSIKWIGNGETATFEGLNTECDYSVTGFFSEIFSVNLKSDGISYANVVERRDPKKRRSPHHIDHTPEFCGVFVTEFH